MTLYLDNEHPVFKLDEPLRALLEKTLLTALNIHGAYDKAEVSLILTDDEQIHKMNLQYRQVDRPTDVLSFPFLDYEESYEEEGDQPEEGFDEDVNPETGEVILGDIVISVDTARRQAQEYGHSFEREMGFLACHGMLHLLGYDHMNEDDERIMRDMQQRVMHEMGLER